MRLREGPLTGGTTETRKPVAVLPKALTGYRAILATHCFSLICVSNHNLYYNERSLYVNDKMTDASIRNYRVISMLYLARDDRGAESGPNAHLAIVETAPCHLERGQLCQPVYLCLQ